MVTTQIATGAHKEALKIYKIVTNECVVFILQEMNKHYKTQAHDLMGGKYKYANIIKAVQQLVRIGLIRRTREGSTVYYKINDERLDIINSAAARLLGRKDLTGH